MDIKNRNKFRLTRFIIFKAVRVFRFLSKFRSPEKRLLIIKLDAIGDYILFRNYLEVLKNSDKFKGYEIDLLGNLKWQELAREYDSSFVSSFSFIDPEELYEMPITTLKLGLKLFKTKYSVVLQSTYSRTLMGNALSGMTAASEIIAFNSLNEHQPKYKKKTDKFYTKLIDLPEYIVHETEMNHFFFETILGKSLPTIIPSLPVSQKSTAEIIVFPGSSTHKKNWEKEKFSEIIKRILLSSAEGNIIITGGLLERPIAKYLKEDLNSDRIVDKTGDTTLPDFINLIAGSKLVISNDTNAVHVASACGVPVVCLLGGGHFNRFLPYPEQFPSKPICIYTVMPCYHCNFICEYRLEDQEAFPCISNIDVEKTWAAVSRLLKFDNNTTI